MNSKTEKKKYCWGDKDKIWSRFIFFVGQAAGYYLTDPEFTISEIFAPLMLYFTICPFISGNNLVGRLNGDFETRS